jgi:hypothetical protein
MTELLILVSLVYVGYVISEFFRAASHAESLAPPIAKPPVEPAAASIADAPAQPAAAVTPEPAEKPATPAKPSPATPESAKKPAPHAAAQRKPAATGGAKPAPVESATPAGAEAAPASQLRDPATGEVSAVPANYRFAKKWLKEALVAEKLLDKVYKPNELDAATSEKVKQAIEKLRCLPKYHP